MNTYPVLIDKYLHLSEHEGIYIDTKEWQQFLNKAESFRVNLPSTALVNRGEFRVRPQQVNNGVYWLANKRVNSRQRMQYLGLPANVTYEKLEEIADLFALPDFQYWRFKRSNDYERRIKQVINSKEAQKTFISILNKVRDKEDGYTIENGQLLVKEFEYLFKDVS